MKRTALKPGKQQSYNSTLRQTGFKKKDRASTKTKQTVRPKSKKTGLSDKWMKKADHLFSILIWYMYGGKCAMCGQPVPFEHRHAHHMIGRANKRFRHDPNNGILFEDRCHNSDPRAPHKSADKFMEWLRTKYPFKAQWLEDNQGKIGSGKPDYEQRCIELERMIAEYQNEPVRL